MLEVEDGEGPAHWITLAESAEVPPVVPTEKVCRHSWSASFGCGTSQLH